MSRKIKKDSKMCKQNPQHIEVANKLEKYCDYGNPSGLNNLLIEAAELLRNSQPTQKEEKN